MEKDVLKKVKPLCEEIALGQNKNPYVKGDEDYSIEVRHILGDYDKQFYIYVEAGIILQEAMGRLINLAGMYKLSIWARTKTGENKVTIVLV